MYVRNAHVCTNMSDVQETDFSFTVLRKLKSFLYASLIMDGIHALILWDLVIEVFHSVLSRTDGPKREPRRNSSAVVKPNMPNPISIRHANVISTNIDHIPSNTTHSGSSAMLSVFEDNAVIKMLIKSRRPTNEHSPTELL